MFEGFFNLLYAMVEDALQLRYLIGQRVLRAEIRWRILTRLGHEQLVGIVSCQQELKLASPVAFVASAMCSKTPEIPRPDFPFLTI
jgi:hypothetical protein